MPSKDQELDAENRRLAARVEGLEADVAERDALIDSTVQREHDVTSRLAARVEELVKSQELAVLDRNEAEDENVRLAARVEQLEAKNAQLESALALIAAPRRADGTYNRSREACEQLAARVLSEGEDNHG